MRRWVLFLPIGFLVMLAGVVGYQLGKPVSESDIINFFAQKYVDEYGGVHQDCMARPSAQPGARLEVMCESGTSPTIIFVVTNRGVLVSTQIGSEFEA